MGVYEIITGITENEENLKVEIRQYMAAYTKKIMSQTLQDFQNTFAKLASEFRKCH